MRVTIDLDQLLGDGKITQDEYDRFSQFSIRATSALAFNILIGFGIIAVGGGLLALLPAPATAIALGLVICALGITVLFQAYEQWMLLGNICVVSRSCCGC